MNAGIPGMRPVRRIGTPTPRALADLGLLRRDDELVETLRLRTGGRAPGDRGQADRAQGDRIARLFHALLAEVDAVPGGRRTLSDHC